jgi:hypothetical protein
MVAVSELNLVISRQLFCNCLGTISIFCSEKNDVLRTRHAQLKDTRQSRAACEGDW